MKLKITLITALMTCTLLHAQTGFNTSPVNWSLPQGGALSSFASFGFDMLSDGSASITGDQRWTTMDLNGDGKPDLVVTAQVVTTPNYNLETVFGLPSTPYWKVYLNNGNGYNSSPINWTLPQGGAKSAVASYGYNAVADYNAQAILGDQSWTTADMNGDNKPDLVVTAEVKAIPNYNVETTFGMPSTPYWKVYLNTGSGFNTTATNWTLPTGGSISAVTSYGFNTFSDGSAMAILGDQSWSTTDMNGDNKPDLVVTAEVKAIPNYNVETTFGLPSTPYWKVYLNNGSGFNTTATNWTLPSGGAISAVTSYGYNLTADYSAMAILGDQSWSTTDMNGDNKPDLVVTSEVKAIPNYNVETTFGLPSTPYWKVYLNTGSGFNTTATNWTLPSGGAISAVTSYGYNLIADGSAMAILGDQSWSTTDMNGDNKPDLVVTAEVKAIPNYNVETTFGLPSTPYWKVHLNTGSGFNTTAINWTLPQGGAISSFVNYGFNAVADYSAGALVGDQMWSIIDIDGNHKMDLAVTSQVVSIPNYNFDQVFGMPSTPYWKVYMNNAVLDAPSFEAANKVIVYPNPSKGIFTIQTEAENITVVISDMTGRTVAQQSGKSIDLSGYTKGVYLMNITMEGQTYTKKIILE